MFFRNQVEIIGNVVSITTKDKIAFLKVAVNYPKFEDQTTGQMVEPDADFIEVKVIKENLRKWVGQYLAQGEHIIVRGKIKTGKYTDSQGNDRYSQDVVARAIDWVGAMSAEKRAKQNQAA